MITDRTEDAVQRIETALGRIAKVADSLPDGDADRLPRPTTGLIEKHETLRETVNSALDDLDKLIAELER